MGKIMFQKKRNEPSNDRIETLMRARMLRPDKVSWLVKLEQCRVLYIKGKS